MCFMCDMWGEGGVWFNNPKAYSRRIYKLRAPGTSLRKYGETSELGIGALMEKVQRARSDDPDQFPGLLNEVNEAIVRQGSGQAVTLKEACDIVDMGMPLASMHCICRKNVRAIEETNAQEYSCLGTGVGMFKWERWPERYRGGVHFMAAQEAKEWLEKWDKAGFMHLVMMIGGNYVEGICNCEYPACLAIRRRLDLGLLTLIKGHYVAQVDYDTCIGCGECIKRCQFGALKFEVRLDKANIDHFACYGCGLCETECTTGAIKMVERKTFPALREVW